MATKKKSTTKRTTKRNTTRSSKAAKTSARKRTPSTEKKDEPEDVKLPVQGSFSLRNEQHKRYAAWKMLQFIRDNPKCTSAQIKKGVELPDLDTSLAAEPGWITQHLRYALRNHDCVIEEGSGRTSVMSISDEGKDILKSGAKAPEKFDIKRLHGRASSREVEAKRRADKEREAMEAAKKENEAKSRKKKSAPKQTSSARRTRKKAASK